MLIVEKWADRFQVVERRQLDYSKSMVHSFILVCLIGISAEVLDLRFKNFSGSWP